MNKMKIVLNNSIRQLVSVFFSLIIVLSSCGKKQEVKNVDINGGWIGTLSSNGMTLNIIFNMSVIGDSLVVTIDSPDQGAYGMSTSSVSFANKKIVVESDQLRVKYKGSLVSDSLFQGTFSQAGASYPLNIKRLVNAYNPRKPQEPFPPYPYEEENVVFHNDSFNIDLSGTLTVPLGDRVYKTAIMITGSGAQNRDEELYGHKPFKVIADYLTRNGIAVLRFDDRGVGESQGDYASATSSDLATDVEAAIKFLLEHPKVDTEHIGLIGHSEGGLIAPIVASRNTNVAFVVSLAGPAVNGKELSLRQSEDINRVLGLKEKKIAQSVALNEMIYDEIIKEPNPHVANANVEQMLRTYLKKKLIFNKLVDIQLKYSMAQLAPENLVWYRYFLMTDASEFWKQTKCPVLALNGSKDLQVAADVNLPAIQNALGEAGNSNYDIRLMSNLNHLFQHCETGNPSEYGNIQETFSEEVLSIIAEWINTLGNDQTEL